MDVLNIFFRYYYEFLLGMKSKTFKDFFTMSFNKVSLSGLLILLISTFSCTSLNKSPRVLFLKNQSYCAPPSYTSFSIHSISQNSDSILIANKTLLSSYTEQNVLMISALALEAEINELEKIKKSNNQDVALKLLKLKEEVNSSLISAQIDINAIAAELDCEGEQIEQLAQYIDSKNNSKINKLTVASIVLGAASSIAGVVIDNNHWNNGVTIGAGILGGGLGFGVLKLQGKKVDFSHKRNLLKSIWLEKNENTTFPPFVWFMLSEKKFSNSGQVTLIQNIKKRWINYQFEGNEKDAKKSIIFTEGGIYKSGDLHNRADMLNQLQSTIRALNQNLNFLMIEIRKNY